MKHDAYLDGQAPLVDGKRPVTFTFYIAGDAGLDKLFSRHGVWSDSFNRALDRFMMAIEAEATTNQ